MATEPNHPDTPLPADYAAGPVASPLTRLLDILQLPLLRLRAH